MENQIYKIIVVDKEEEMGHKIRETFQNVGNTQCSVKWFSSFVVEEVKGAYCVIIDSRLVKDVKNLIDVLKALSVQKIILATNELNHPLSSVAIMMGALVFYRHSPITTLIYKIFDSYNKEQTNQKKLDGNKLHENNSDKTKGKFVAIASPKGGTGKTTIAVNTAIQLAKKDVKTLLLDLSLFGNIGVKLKVDQNTNGLRTLFSQLHKNNKGSKQAEDIIQKSIYSYSNNGIRFDVLTADSPLNMAKLGTEAIEFLSTLIRTMNYDVVIIDTSTGISKLNLSIFEMCDEIILSAVPDISCTWSFLQNKEIMQDLNLTEKCKLVVNMYSNNLGFSFKELETQLQYPLISVIPDYKQIKILENSGSTLGLKFDDQINMYYRQIAHSIVPVFGFDELKSGEQAKKHPSLMNLVGGIKKKVQK